MSLSPHHRSAIEYYAGEAGSAYHDIKRALSPEGLALLTRFRARKFQPHIVAGDIVVEYGVGAGWNLARLECGRKIGIDAAEILADRVRALGIEFESDLGKLQDNLADVVICHHVLEHIEAPLDAVRSMLRVLKPGGKLLLCVPWERERRYGTYDPAEPNHHLYTWNAQTLGNFATLAGLRIESLRVFRYGYDRFAANTAAKWGLGDRGFVLLRAWMIAVRPLREIMCLGRKELP